MKIFILFSVLLTLSPALMSQESCRVLLPQIVGNYSGSCKKGLADGPGEAIGIDRYRGNFKKGLPDGLGRYVWVSGESYEGSWQSGLREGQGTYTYKIAGRDSVVAGLWSKDNYIGVKAEEPYTVTYKNSISRVSFVKLGTLPSVMFKFSRAGGPSDGVTNLLMQGSSGDEVVMSNFTGYDNVTFPFESTVRFNAPSLLHSIILNCELRFRINQPGSWLVTISY